MYERRSGTSWPNSGINKEAQHNYFPLSFWFINLIISCYLCIHNLSYEIVVDYVCQILIVGEPMGMNKYCIDDLARIMWDVQFAWTMRDEDCPTLDHRETGDTTICIWCDDPFHQTEEEFCGFQEMLYDRILCSYFHSLTIESTHLRLGNYLMWNFVVSAWQNLWKKSWCSCATGKFIWHLGGSGLSI